MSKLKEQAWTLGAIVLVALLVLVMAISGPSRSSAASLGAPTPVVFANNGGRVAEGARVAVFFSGTPAAYNTPVTNCFDMRNYSVMDTEWTLASVTTMTVTLLHGADTSRTVVGQTLVNANATPVATPSMQQYPLYGAQQCVKVQSANGTPVAVWVNGLGK